MGARRSHVSGSAAAATAAPQTVPVTAIAHNPRNPREHYDDVDELASSICQVGILSPLGLMRYETFLNHYPAYEHDIGVHDWVVVNGNRRLAAAHQAQLEEVPVYVLDRLGRGQQIDEGLLIDNIHSAQLPPLLEAQLLAELQDRHGSQTAVANRIGKTNGYVSQRLALLKLVPELQESVRTGELNLELARRVAKTPKNRQADELARLRDEQQDHRNGFYAVKADDKTGDDDTHDGRDSTPDNNQSKSGPQTGARASKPVPIEQRARQLRREYTTDQCRQLAELLTGD